MLIIIIWVVTVINVFIFMSVFNDYAVAIIVVVIIISGIIIIILIFTTMFIITFVIFITNATINIVVFIVIVNKLFYFDISAHVVSGVV